MTLIGNPADVLTRASAYSASLLFDAHGSGALPPNIRPLDRRSTAHGYAFTVSTGGNFNYRIREALSLAGTQDVLVVETGGTPSTAFVGSVLSTYAKERGIRALIIDNYVRDSDEIIRLGLPCFCAGLTIVPAERAPTAKGALRGEISIGTATVRHGDLIVADSDGIIAVPANAVGQVLARAEGIKTAETPCWPISGDRAEPTIRASMEAVGVSRNDGSRPVMGRQL